MKSLITSFVAAIAGLLFIAVPQSLFASTEVVYIANWGNGLVRGLTTDGLDIGNITTNSVNQAQGIAIDTANNLYVASTSSNLVRRFSPSGVDMGVFAATGISDPRSIIFDSSGNLYVANVGTATVRRFSPTGVDLGNFISNGLANPTGMAFDEAGNLYVANYGLNQVKKFAPDGTYLGVAISEGLSQPIGLIAIPQTQGGGFYVANDFASSIIRYNAAGEIVSTLTSGTLGRLHYLASDSAGNIYVSRHIANAVRKFSSTGQDLGDFAVAGMSGPAAIVVRPASSSLSLGLIAYYPFSGNANDVSGNGNHGFANNAVLSPDRFGISNAAYKFNGANAQILVNDNVALQSLNSNYTFSAWVKFASFPNRDMSILMKSLGAGSQNNKWTLWKHVNPPFGVGVLTDGNFNIVQRNYDFPFITNRWYLISYTAAGTNATISVDGVTVSAQTGNLELPDTTGATLAIGGAEPGGNQWFNGDLDDIRIYDRALSASELAQLHAVGSGRILNVRKAVYLDSTLLEAGTDYQVQFSTNLSEWSNVGAAFTATNSNWRTTNYWDVDSWDNLFFRVLTLE